MIFGGLLTAPAGAEDADPPAAPAGIGTGFYEVTVDLDTGSFNRGLDFDRPIRISGATPTEATEISVQYAEARSSLVLVNPNLCQVQETKRGTVVPLLPATPIRAIMDAKTSKFYALVPALPANHYFVFCFFYDKPVSAEEAAAFEPRALKVLDQSLAELGTGNMTEAKARELSAELRRNLLAVAGSGRILDPNSLFEESQAASTLTDAASVLNQKIVAVLIPQRKAQRALEGDAGNQIPPYRQRQLDFRQQLDAIRGSAALSSLLDGLATATAGNPNLNAAIHPEYDGAIALARSTDATAARIAFGQPLTGAAGDTLLTTVDPATAASTAASYGLTSAELGKLHELVGKLLGADPPVDLTASLTAADRASLTQLTADDGPVLQASDATFELQGLAENIRSSLQQRSDALADLAHQVSLVARGVKIAAASSTLGYNSLQAAYVSADAGIAYAPDIDTVVKYIGTNIYFRPVNKDVPLSQVDSFSRRFSLTVGLTLDSVDDQNATTMVRTRDDLFGSQSLVVGAGLRFNRILRIGVGALVFKEQNPNPLVDDQSVAVSPYVQFSFDLNIAKAFQGGFGALFQPGG